MDGTAQATAHPTQAGYVLHVGQVESKGDLKVGDEVSVKVPGHQTLTTAEQLAGIKARRVVAFRTVTSNPREWYDEQLEGSIVTHAVFLSLNFLDVAHSVCLEFSGTLCIVCLLFFPSLLLPFTACTRGCLAPGTSFIFGARG